MYSSNIINIYSIYSMVRKSKRMRKSSVGRGVQSRKTQQQRRRTKATRARHAARARKSRLAKRRSLASTLAKESVAEHKRRQDAIAVRDYMDKYYSYDPDDAEFYSQDWQWRQGR